MLVFALSSLLFFFCPHSCIVLRGGPKLRTSSPASRRNLPAVIPYVKVMDPRQSLPDVLIPVRSLVIKRPKFILISQIFHGLASWLRGVSSFRPASQPGRHTRLVLVDIMLVYAGG